MTREDAVAGIAATVTAQGLKCTAVLDDATYAKGTEVPAGRVRHVEGRPTERDLFHGEWNYAILPVPRPEPEPEPEPAAPSPDLRGLAALADVPDLPALLAAVAVPWQAAREQRLHMDRGHARRKASGGTPKRLPFDAIVTAAACHLRLRMPCRLLGELLGVDGSTVNLAASRVIPLLGQHGITPSGDGTRITTITELREHAKTTGITAKST